MFKKILVATDGSNLSLKAAERGMELAKLFGADLKIAYVIDQRVFFFPHEVQELSSENPYFTIMEELLKNAESVLENLQKKAKDYQVEFESIIQEGVVVDEIVKLIKEHNIDLLLIGAHGAVGEKRGILGSTAQSLTNSVPCSLLITRP